MQKFKSNFSAESAVIGVIHLKALPGTPKNDLEPSQIIDIALKEADIYKKAGVDTVMIENMHDVPYLKGQVGPEISSLMTVIAYQIKQHTHLKVGIQVLAAANKEAMGAAKASGIDFIRAEGFVFAHTADEGLIDAQAGELMRYRKQIGAEHIAVFTDIKKKHSSHAITQDVSLLDTARAARFFLSDGLIITGNLTGQPPSIEDLKTVRDNLDSPVIVGSGMTIDNLSDYIPLCDAMIVGSHFKDEGYWGNDLNYDRVARFIDHLKRES